MPKVLSTALTPENGWLEFIEPVLLNVLDELSEYSPEYSEGLCRDIAGFEGLKDVLLHGVARKALKFECGNDPYVCLILADKEHDVSIQVGEKAPRGAIEALLQLIADRHLVSSRSSDA